MSEKLSQFAQLTPTLASFVAGANAGSPNQKYLLSDVQNTIGPFVNVKNFGAKGDGVTDDSPAFIAALASLGTQGGTLYIPPGNYFITQSIAPQSNVSIQGAGASTTISINNVTLPPFNCAVLIAGNGGINPTVSYAINNPITEGTKSLTTTNHADAGNFSPGDHILIHGPLVGGGFIPNWFTTVASANAGTGVITLNEGVPSNDADINAVSKLSSVATNIKVADLSIISSVDTALQITFAQNITIQRVNFPNFTGAGAGVGMDSTRDAILSNSMSSGANFSYEAGGSWNVIFENIVAEGGIFVFDAGTCNSTMRNCIANNPFSNAFNITTGAQRNRLIGCGAFDVPTGFNGMVIQGDLAGTDHEGSNIIVGNTIICVDKTGSDGIDINTSDNNIVVGNNIQNVNVGVRCANSLNTTISLNTFQNINASNETFDSSSTVQMVLLPMTFGTVLSGTTFAVGTSGGFVVFNAVPTTVTSFTGGQNGQQLFLVFGDANTTLSNSIGRIAGNIPYNPPAQTMMQFMNVGGVWYEVSRSND